MKKTFGVLLVLALVLVLSLSMTAFAAETGAEGETIPTTVYTNTITPLKYTLPADGVTKVDVVNENNVVEVGGYYYLGDKTGPLVLVNLNEPDPDPTWFRSSFVEITGDTRFKTVIYKLTEDGSWLTDDNGAPVSDHYEDYNEAMKAYISCSDNSYYPLTKDLAYMIQTYGTNQGWWGNVVDSAWANPVYLDDVGDDAWMYCCYAWECTHPNIQAVEGKDPTCDDDGLKAHSYCPDCYRYFLEGQVVSSDEVVLPGGCKNMGKLEHVGRVERGCHTLGNIEYWHCTIPTCDRYYEDADCTRITTVKSVVLPKINMTEYTAAKDPTCHDEGNCEYWYCPGCQKYFTDEAMTKESKYDDLFKKAIGPTQSPEHYAAKDPTCHDEGWVEHWYCYDCETYFADEACTIPESQMRFMRAPLGSKNIEHYAAKDPTCHDEGWVEHWYCYDCETYFADEACKRAEPQLRFMRAPLGSENVVHYEALDPTCHQEGWGEHWYCPDCDTRFADKDCHIVDTRYKRPATGSDKMEHVAAKAPTAKENGNVEYWHCPDCDSYWTDEALTKVTNSKSVILPASDPIPATSDSFQLVMIAQAILSVTGAAGLVIGKKRFF